MKVGDLVSRIPVSFYDIEINTGKRKPIPMKGKVVYIHSKGRYHVVEFNSGVRESFAGA